MRDANLKPCGAFDRNSMLCLRALNDGKLKMNQSIAAGQARYPSLSMVAISGFAMNATVRQELDVRRVPFVDKPFTSEELAQAVALALEGKSKRTSTNA